MSDTNRPESAALNESTPSPAIGHEAADQQAGTSPINKADEDRARIDREVADAMAAMDSQDVAELGGMAAPGGEMPASTEPGTEIVGTVAGVGDEDVFIEFGPKLQGVLPRAQFGKKEPLEVGRRVDCVVERFDPQAGLLIVCRKGAIQRATWTNLAIGNIVEGRVTGLIKGGLELDLKGIRAFMPGSQVDMNPVKDISVLLNEVVACEVIEVDRRGKNVVVSRRRLLEREQAEKREQLRGELEVGQIRKGIVRRIADFGAFVDIGGIDGLLHIRDLSWGTVDKVTDVLNVDQEVEVRILKIDEKRDRISLGLKQALPDPWQGVDSRFPVGETCKVRVVRIANFGAFAELETGIEGLIPISEMSWGHIRNPQEVVSVGSLVDCKIIRVEPQKRRIALSIKQAQQDPWAGVLESFAPQSLVTGKVTRLAEFGAFVELTPGVEGLIHISEMSDKRIKTCAEVVSEGQEVETRVLGVDPESRRISLSIKQVKEPVSEPSRDAVHATAHAAQQSKKRKKPLRGGLSSHFEW